jgi:hypothetical protein
MKALTLWEPWASLIALGAKKIETRSWPTNYRGPLAIHASVRPPSLDNYVQVITDALYADGPHLFHLGCVIAIVDLVDCVKMTQDMITYLRLSEPGRNELAFGHWDPGRYAWILASPRRIEPVPSRGKQGLWTWDGDSALDIYTRRGLVRDEDC